MLERMMKLMDLLCLAANLTEAASMSLDTALHLKNATIIPALLSSGRVKQPHLVLSYAFYRTALRKLGGENHPSLPEVCQRSINF